MNKELKIKLLSTLIDKTTNNEIIWGAEICSDGNINYTYNTDNVDIVICVGPGVSVQNMFLRTNKSGKCIVTKIVGANNRDLYYRDLTVLSMQLVCMICVNINKCVNWEELTSNLINNLTDIEDNSINNYDTQENNNIACWDKVVYDNIYFYKCSNCKHISIIKNEKCHKCKSVMVNAGLILNNGVYYSWKEIDEKLKEVERKIADEPQG